MLLRLSLYYFDLVWFCNIDNPCDMSILSCLHKIRYNDVNRIEITAIRATKRAITTIISISNMLNPFIFFIKNGKK